MFSWDKKGPTTITNGGITIQDILSDDAPAFERSYTVKLDDRATLRISVKTFLNARRPNGELSQQDGKWVSFDPMNIAEKILDRTLVPLIEDRCREIVRLDRDFARNLPDEFVDREGTRWRKVS